jgi:hypothetical protein
VRPEPRRIPAVTAAVTAGLAAVTAVVVLAFFGKIPLGPRGGGEEGRVFYVVPYHYGFAFYDGRFAEIERIQVREGEVITLHIVSASALAKETFLEYSERTLARDIGGLAAGDPRIRKKVVEDAELGNIEHIIGIASYPVYVTTSVAPLLGGKPFRDGGPRTVREAVRGRDPSIKTVTFTAKKVGAFDVLCVDSGMDGAGTCGWGHKWMVAREGFVVEK